MRFISVQLSLLALACVGRECYSFSPPTTLLANTCGGRKFSSPYQCPYQYQERRPQLHAIQNDLHLADHVAVDVDVDVDLDVVNSVSFLLNHVTADIASPGSGSSSSVLNNLLSNPSFWAVAVMLSIVGLLYTWEEAIHNVRQTVPKPLSPVIDSMLGEVGGLGFIGLFLEIFVTRYPNRGIGGLIGELSENFLGEREILLEAFESLHSSFFEVGVAFFAVTGTIVGGVLLRINDLSNISQLVLDTDGDGMVSLDEIATAMDAEVMTVDLDGDGILTEDEKMEALRNIPSSSSSSSSFLLPELFLTPTQRASEMLLVRERLLSQNDDILSSTTTTSSSSSNGSTGVGDTTHDFQVEAYFEQIFGKNLREMVELSPLTWLPLIPLLSILNAVDLSNEIVSASSENAWVSSGCFLSSPYFVTISSASTFLCLGWGIWNFWKLTSIKNMLLPTLVRDDSREGGSVGSNSKNGSAGIGEAILLPPRYEDDALRNSFTSSPGIMASIERMLVGRKASTSTTSSCRHEQLFGASGSDGPRLYLRSIQFHTWLCVANSVFFMGQIVTRDIFTLIDYDHGKGILAASEIGNIDLVAPELCLYSTFVILLVGQMAITPTVFLNYCTATSIEEMTQGWAIEKARLSSSSSSSSSGSSSGGEELEKEEEEEKMSRMT